MGSAKRTTTGDALAAFLASCQHPLRVELDELRAIVHAAAPELIEGVKWNAPSWHAPEHEDCITCNLGKDCLRVVFHRGAKQKGAIEGTRFVAIEHDWLEWPAADRAVATFHSGAEIRAAKAGLGKLVRAWLAACAGKQG